ncbi:unnamed protein product, partial [Nesidiocoris tenuis]
DYLLVRWPTLVGRCFLLEVRCRRYGDGHLEITYQRYTRSLILYDLHFRRFATPFLDMDASRMKRRIATIRLTLTKKAKVTTTARPAATPRCHPSEKREMAKKRKGPNKYDRNWEDEQAYSKTPTRFNPCQSYSLYGLSPRGRQGTPGTTWVTGQKAIAWNGGLILFYFIRFNFEFSPLIDLLRPVNISRGGYKGNRPRKSYVENEEDFPSLETSIKGRNSAGSPDRRRQLKDSIKPMQFNPDEQMSPDEVKYSTQRHSRPQQAPSTGNQQQLQPQQMQQQPIPQQQQQQQQQPPANYMSQAPPPPQQGYYPPPPQHGMCPPPPPPEATTHITAPPPAQYPQPPPVFRLSSCWSAAHDVSAASGSTAGQYFSAAAKHIRPLSALHSASPNSAGITTAMCTTHFLVMEEINSAENYQISSSFSSRSGSLVFGVLGKNFDPFKSFSGDDRQCFSRRVETPFWIEQAGQFQSVNVFYADRTLGPIIATPGTEACKNEKKTSIRSR